MTTSLCFHTAAAAAAVKYTWKIHVHWIRRTNTLPIWLWSMVNTPASNSSST